MSRQFVILAGASLVALALVFMGFFHVVSGGDISTRYLAKRSFGFSETFVNVDEITGMPWIAARAKYPLACKLLQDEGILESEDSRKDRLRRETLERFGQ